MLLLALTSGAQPVTQIAAGGYHSLFLKSDGSLWAMGFNGYGQLGDGTTNNVNRPEQIVASNVTAMAAGGYYGSPGDGSYSHNLFLKSDGSLWAMGANNAGQLGDGSYTSTNRPEQIVASNVMAIAAGRIHSLFLKNDGSLWVMGDNEYGQLGDGTYNNANLPQQTVASNIIAIAAGYGHSLILKSDGSLWGMGNNSVGQLGDGTTNNAIRPEQIVASNVTAVAVGEYHSLFLKREGSLWAMGLNYYGQLGDSTYNNTNRPEQIVASNVTAIAAGFWHSVFLKQDGSVWTMGDNRYGELADGTFGVGSYPKFTTNQPEQVVASGVRAIAAGQFHNLFLKNDGSLWAVGFNGDGQLGDGTLKTINRPEQILAPYNQAESTGQSLNGTNLLFSFVGIANATYALDRTFSLSPPIDWIPRQTNPANSFGAMVFTNAPDPATNNFWRIRSVP